MTTTEAKAIKAALANNWTLAIDLNQQILDRNPNDVEALNRLAYSYIQIGDLKKACRLYKRVLTLDKFNTIARKNLNKFANQPKSCKPASTDHVSVSPTLFLEEPGKTKVAELVNVASSEVLIQLKVGEPLNLIRKRHSIEVRNSKKAYLGALPDDLSFHLRKLMLKGTCYQIYVKGVAKNSLTVFIKELRRSRRQNQPTFSHQAQKTFHPFVEKESFSS